MSALVRVQEAFARLAVVDRPEVWTHLRAQADVEAEASVVDARVASGEDLPLAGLLAAVKDNIDVAGLPTTAGVPGLVREVVADATAVGRLRAAGVVVLGKTNLDQLATGLVGTRSPFGQVRSASHPDRISGGSSSGSAVAVALGVVDLGVATDTAGSGRVPAALQGIVGVKGTVGRVPATGVVPACRSLDCVTLLARELPLAARALALVSGPDGVDVLARELPADAPLAGPEDPVLAVPRAEDLGALDPAWREAFLDEVVALRTAGFRMREIDLSPFLEAARLLYDGAFVAERYAAVGEVVESGLPGLDPVVARIVHAAKDLPAHRLVTDRLRLAELARDASIALEGADVLLVPTTTHHPTLAEVAADPVGVNSRLGTFTNFANLLDMPAVAFPVPSGAHDGPVGVSLLARTGHDASLLDVAARALARDPRTVRTEVVGPGTAGSARGVDLLVVGAHLEGMPAHARLRRFGAVPRGEVRTASGYRLVELGDALDRPGLVRDPSHDGDVAGELWRVPRPALADLLLESAAPLGLGHVLLADGREVVGYLCEHAGAVGRPGVADGSWRSVRGTRA